MLTGTIHFEVLTAGTPNLAERRNLWGDNPIRLRPAGPAEDPESKLIGAVELPGHCSFHLEAYRIANRPHPSLVAGEETSTEQVCDGPREVEEQYVELANEMGGDGPFETAKIGYRDYVLTLLPYCT